MPSSFPPASPPTSPLPDQPSSRRAQADRLNSLGVQLARQQQDAAALAYFRQALHLQADHGEAWNNIGLLLAQAGQHQAALAHYARALECAADCHAALYNQARSLVALQAPAEALLCLQRYLPYQPQHADARSLYIQLLSLLWQHAAAAEASLQLLAQAPDYPLLRGKLLQSRLYCCDWRDWEVLRTQVRTAVLAGELACTPFAFINVAREDGDELRCAQRYAASIQPRHRLPALVLPPTQARIRIAYVSAHFHEHALSFLLAGVFEQHDASRFECMAVSLGPPSTDAMRQRLRAAFAVFVEAGTLDDATLAQQLRALHIDIVIDLAGYNTDSRPALLAHRVAPVQVNYLGYPGTLGSGYHDYLIADAILIPEDRLDAYSEQVVYLPDSYQANDNRRPLPVDTGSRISHGLPAQGVVFCCFNNSYKLTPPLLDIWLHLLAEVPGSVLWLLDSVAEARDNLRAYARNKGIETTRLVFAPRLPQTAHLARHVHADLFLDTLPVNAHTTAADALWAGLPVLTCRGQTFSGRVGASLLHAVGLPELVTDTLADYTALALQLARAPARLANLRQRLQQQRGHCALFDTTRLCRYLEVAYLHMHARARQGLAPQGFRIHPFRPATAATHKAPRADAAD